MPVTREKGQCPECQEHCHCYSRKQPGGKRALGRAPQAQTFFFGTDGYTLQAADAFRRTNICFLTDPDPTRALPIALLAAYALGGIAVNR